MKYLERSIKMPVKALNPGIYGKHQKNSCSFSNCMSFQFGVTSVSLELKFGKCFSQFEFCDLIPSLIG